VTVTLPSDWAARLGKAREVVTAALPPTPLIPAPGLGNGMLLKLESFQPTGSFKVRGALAALSAAENAGGVVTASTGNHALGVAWAAQRLGIPATVVVPASASLAKLASLRRFPATLLVHGHRYEDAEQHARSLATGGLRYLSASSDPNVIAGQATIGFELLTQLSGSCTVICGVGGGGLASGLGLAASRSGRMTAIGIEAAASPAMSTAIRAGRVCPVEIRDTLADGLAGNLEPGTVTVNLIRDHARRLIAVTEDQIAEAIRYLAREHGVIAEGAGAAPVAAILVGAIPVTGQTVAIISGRNITLRALADVLQTGQQSPATRTGNSGSASTQAERHNRPKCAPPESAADAEAGRTY
jgi:threonine dehydratase